MAKINVLDSSIYNRIAAGEVVERPASVVKELVENSIDAGATNIVVEIEYGGIRGIKVVDNGCGVEKEYMREAFMPHATSKISTADDLDSIMTLGFRGEALASIAAVSHVAMTSKVKEEELGSFIEIEAGKILKMNEVGAKDGTTMVVRDLFFNVPARAKFLKKPKSEEQEVTNLVSRLMLANPNISFRYIVDGRTLFTSSGKTLKEAIFGIYGKEALTETLEINLAKDDMKIKGYIGRPSFSKPNRTYQTLIVNGRFVNDNLISLAVANAYGDMLMKRRFPFFVLSLELPFTDVDANVHPNKLEVRFAYPNKIYSLFFEAVSRALHEMDYVSSVTAPESKQQVSNFSPEIKESFYVAKNDTKSISIPVSKVEQKPSKIDKAGVNLNPFSANFNKMSREEIEKTQQKVMSSATQISEGGKVADGFGLGSKLMDRLNEAAKNKDKNQEKPVNYVIGGGTQINADVKLIGKAFNTYLIVELDGDIFFIDQHAAHERLLYEKFRRQVENSKITIQPLLIPYILTLNSTEADLLEKNIDIMQELGIDIVEFGNNSFKVSAVPSLLCDINFDEFFGGFLTETRFAGNKADLIKEKLMQQSCKSAVKGGNDLSISEINKLFENMSNEKIPLFCPHGRPIAVRVSKTEIEKWFKRIV